MKRSYLHANSQFVRPLSVSSGATSRNRHKRKHQLQIRQKTIHYTAAASLLHRFALRQKKITSANNYKTNLKQSIPLLYLGVVELVD